MYTNWFRTFWQALIKFTYYNSSFRLSFPIYSWIKGSEVKNCLRGGPLVLFNLLLLHQSCIQPWLSFYIKSNFSPTRSLLLMWSQPSKLKWPCFYIKKFHLPPKSLFRKCDARAKAKKSFETSSVKKLHYSM